MDPTPSTSSAGTKSKKEDVKEDQRYFSETEETLKNARFARGGFRRVEAALPPSLDTSTTSTSMISRGEEVTELCLPLWWTLSTRRNVSAAQKGPAGQSQGTTPE